MNLSQKQKKQIGAVFIIFVLIAIYGSRTMWLPVPDDTTYHDVGYSFTYPRLYHISEYGIGVASLGRPFGDTYTPLVEVVQYDSDPDVALPKSYDAFVMKQAIDICGSDSSVESITCTATSTTRYTSAQGLSGKELMLTLTRKNLVTSTTTKMAYGPFYGFNMTPKPTKDSPLRYRVLLVYPSLEAFVAGTSSPKLLQTVIDSLVIPAGSTIGE
jgi:hypothetical protein